MTVVKEANFLYLLIGLLALLLAGPLSYELVESTGSVLFSSALVAMMLIGVWSLQASKKWFWLGIVLALTSLLLSLGDVYATGLYFRILNLLVGLAFIVLTLVFAAEHLISSTNINGNRLIGAMCVYLLLGLALAMINLMVNALMPGSFSGLTDENQSQTSMELVYYTFVTMTTLGYGDISPVRPLARSIAYITAIIGQFYLTILVALLIGLYLRRKD